MNIEDLKRLQTTDYQYMANEFELVRENGKKYVLYGVMREDLVLMTVDENGVYTVNPVFEMINFALVAILEREKRTPQSEIAKIARGALYAMYPIDFEAEEVF